MSRRERLGPYSVPDFAKFCQRLTLDNGAPLKLEPFQRTILRDYFHGARESVIILPKKNGKTTLLAALGLYHLARTEQAECVVAASSRDQAKILFNQAAKIIRKSGLEEEGFRAYHGYREIRYQKDENWVMRVLAADADTADGVIPTLGLVDELHRHKSSELYGVFADGLEPRDGQLVTISTAGADVESPLGLLREEAYKHPVERVGPYRRAAAEDGDFVMHEWALEDGQDDVEDLELVAECNPASWQTVAALRRRRVKPSMTPWRWKRFACGIWTDVEEPWISQEEWDACEGKPDLNLASEWFVGIDIGQIFDSSGVVTVGLVGDKLHVGWRVWNPEPKKPVRIAEVKSHVVEVAESGRVRQIGYDPMRFNESGEELEERGMPMVLFPQTDARMVPASNNLYDLVRQGRIVHDGSPVLAKHVMAGVPAERESGWRISKKRSRGKIDLLIALVVAADLAMRAEPKKHSVYEGRFAQAA